MSVMLVVIVLLLLMSVRVTSLSSLMYPLPLLLHLLQDEMMMSYVVFAVVVVVP